jgi:hypothetical protein
MDVSVPGDGEAAMRADGDGTDHVIQPTTQIAKGDDMRTSV